MAQHHLDRLTSTDASFLHQEGACSHMHIGGVLVFEGPMPIFDDVLDHIRGRLHMVPRYRQKLATPPFDTGRPLWVDDPNFNIEYHIRAAALPAPGSERQLLELTARLASQPLDRAKPLWECWLVEGLEPAGDGDGERFAMIFKTHHSLVDGVAGVDLATVLLDVTPQPPDVTRAALEPWRPRPEPSPAQLVAAGVRGAVGAAVDMASRTMTAAVQPSRTLGAVKDRIEGVGEIIWAGLNPAPDTPLNVPIGPHRRFRVVTQQLADYKLVKSKLGGTVNDVMLTVVSGALAGWLNSRGIRTEGVEMRALVPVSVRGNDQHDTLGNRLTAMRGPLPVYIRDAAARLAVVRAAMDGLKESKQAVGAATLTAVNDLAPPTILAQASRLQFSTRLFNLLVTNIPGPQFPLYLLGRRMQDLFPLAFLPQNHALAVAIMSYDGRIEYGLLGDFDALPDIDVIADGIEATLQELLLAARSNGDGQASRSRNGANANNGASANGGAGESTNGPATEEHPTTPLLPTPRRRTTGGPAADMRERTRAGRRTPKPPPEDQEPR